MDYLDETMPYKKKSKRRAPAKAKHKHDFQPCIFEYEGIQFDSAHGVIPKEKEMFGDYYVVCGKIGHRSDNRWMERVPTSIRGVFSFEYTEEAKRELNRGTRTLPTFRLKDIWAQKFVQIER